MRACCGAGRGFPMSAFIRKQEDFVCGHCKLNVSGSEPGDRAEPCGGMIEPTSLEGTTPRYRIVHTCQKCAAVRRVKADDADDADAIVTLSGREALRAKG